MVQRRIDVVPVTLPQANGYVAALHRHHAPIPPGFPWFCVGAVADGALVGVAIAGRPTNRNSDDGQTCEVLRLATDGTANAPSALLGACARAAKAIGAQKIITYTLDSESGASLRGAGWVNDRVGIRSYWGDAKTRTPAVIRDHFDETKSRWTLVFRSEAIAWSSKVEAASVDQLSLLGGGA